MRSFLILSRQTAYYGLLVCLVALLALGSLPLHIGRLAASDRGPAERAPGKESRDEERESEQESKEVAPLRRGVAVGRPAKGQTRLFRTVSRRGPVSYRALPRLSGEHSARNGWGGPLRL